MGSNFYRMVRFLCGWFYKLWFNPKIIGSENIKEDGPLIIVCNHRHKLDPCASVVSTKRVIHYMAKDKYYEKNPFFKWMGCIKVKSNVSNKEAVSLAIDLLNNGGVLGIFPEGTRNKTENKLLPFKYGTVKIAQETGAYIVPAAISGDYRFRSHNLVIRYGKPFKVLSDEDLTLANERLKEEILKLMK